MTARLLPTLVTIAALAFPAAAVAQDDPLSDYGTTSSTSTTAPPTTPKPKPKAPVKGVTDSGTTPTPAPAPAPAAPNSTVAPAATGATPSKLAYTGSEVWLVGLLGLLAVAGGTALMRTSRKA